MKKSAVIEFIFPPMYRALNPDSIDESQYYQSSKKRVKGPIYREEIFFFSTRVNKMAAE